MKYILPLLALAVLISCKKEDNNNNNDDNNPNQGLQEITSKSQMDTEIMDGVSLVFYHASWCSICNGQRPHVSEVAQDMDLSAVFFGEVEYEDHNDITNAYNVTGFPTMVIYKDGSEVDRLVGGNNATADIKSAIQAQL